VTEPRILRRRPATVEAWQVDEFNLLDVATWCGGTAAKGIGVWVVTDTGQPAVAKFGDWMIKGPFGEFYPAPDRVVFSNYEAVIPVVAE
jgi:hypothetical protein